MIHVFTSVIFNFISSLVVQQNTRVFWLIRTAFTLQRPQHFASHLIDGIGREVGATFGRWRANPNKVYNHLSPLFVLSILYFIYIKKIRHIKPRKTIAVCICWALFESLFLKGIWVMHQGTWIHIHSDTQGKIKETLHLTKTWNADTQAKPFQGWTQNWSRK